MPTFFAGKTTCAYYCLLKIIALVKPTKIYNVCCLGPLQEHTQVQKEHEKGPRYLSPVGLYQFLVVKSQIVTSS